MASLFRLIVIALALATGLVACVNDDGPVDPDTTPLDTTDRNDPPDTTDEEALDTITPPAIHYAFDGNAIDSGRYGLHGDNAFVKPMADRHRRVGGATEFDGYQTHFEIRPPASFSLSKGLSISVWVNPRGWRTMGVAGSTVRSPWHLGFSETRDIVFHFNGMSGPDLRHKGYVPLTWTHIVATYDNRMMRMYVDGARTDSFAVAASIADDTAAVAMGWAYWGGLDDLRIYDRAISHVEVRELHNE